MIDVINDTEEKEFQKTKEKRVCKISLRDYSRKFPEKIDEFSNLWCIVKTPAEIFSLSSRYRR